MSLQSLIRKNVPTVALHSIKSMVAGGYKSGKTRLWKEVTELHYKNPAEETVLLAFEAGYETWELESIIPIHEQGNDVEQWEFFRNVVVKELVKAAANGDKKIKLIGWDTVDRAIDAATAWILHRESRRHGKQFTSLQDISEQTNDNGWILLYEELKKQVDALDNAGYGQMFLAWTKEKETTLYNGLKYNSLDLMMNSKARQVFESQSSFICTLFNEVKIMDKEGNILEENIKDKKGRERATNFHQTKVVMLFRPNEYVSVAGGRYVNLPEEPVDYSAEAFLKTFEEAVKGQLKKTKTDIEQLQIQEEQKRLEKGKEYAEKIQNEVSTDDLIKQIDEKLKEIPSNVDRKVIAEKFKEILGDVNYKKATDVGALREVIEYLNSL